MIILLDVVMTTFIIALAILFTSIAMCVFRLYYYPHLEIHSECRLDGDHHVEELVVRNGSRRTMNDVDLRIVLNDVWVMKDGSETRMDVTVYRTIGTMHHGEDATIMIMSALYSNVDLGKDSIIHGDAGSYDVLWKESAYHGSAVCSYDGKNVERCLTIEFMDPFYGVYVYEL